MDIKAQKVVVRGYEGTKVMFVGVGKMELIVNSDQTIWYISTELSDLVKSKGVVKFVNSIATIILEEDEGVVIATLTTRLLNTLVTDQISIIQLHPEYFRFQRDDQVELYMKTKIYNKLYSDLSKRIEDMENLADRSVKDITLLAMLQEVIAFIDDTKIEDPRVIKAVDRIMDPRIVEAMEEAAVTRE